MGTTHGMLESPDPSTHHNFILLDDRIQDIEKSLEKVKALVKLVDETLQKLLVGEAITKIRVVNGRGDKYDRR